MTKMSDNLEDNGVVSAAIGGLPRRFERNRAASCARGLAALTVPPPPPPENPGARLSRCAPPGKSPNA